MTTSEYLVLYVLFTFFSSCVSLPYLYKGRDDLPAKCCLYYLREEKEMSSTFMNLGARNIDTDG